MYMCMWKLYGYYFKQTETLYLDTKHLNSEKMFLLFK